MTSKWKLEDETIESTFHPTEKIFVVNLLKPDGTLATRFSADQNDTALMLLSELNRDRQDEDLRQLVLDLIVAATTGECPDRTCPMCVKKWATVNRAREFLR